MKLRNIYLSLIFTLAGLININLVSAMEHDSKGTVMTYADKVPGVVAPKDCRLEDFYSDKGDSKTSCLICNKCEHPRSLIFRVEKDCLACYKHNLRQDREMTLMINPKMADRYGLFLDEASEVKGTAE